MRIPLTLGLALCGAVKAHSGGVHVHDHEREGEGAFESPLHEREWVKDSPEELERKWSFEVSSLLLFLPDR